MMEYWNDERKFMKTMSYVYLGDRMTGKNYKGQICEAVRRSDGKCIRGRGKMLVSFNGIKVIVIARLLRKENSEFQP